MPIKQVDTRMIGSEGLLRVSNSYLTNLTSINVSSTNVFADSFYVNNILKNVNNWDEAYTAVQTNSASWVIDTNIDTGVRALTSNWQNAYYISTAYQSASGTFLTNIPESLSANWETAYSLVSGGVATTDYVNTNFLLLSGGIINGNLTVVGNVSASGSITYSDTIVVVTTAVTLSVDDIFVNQNLTVNGNTSYIASLSVVSLTANNIIGIDTALTAVDTGVRALTSDWETAYNITTAYQSVSGSFLTNIPESLSANWQNAYSITTAYQNVSGSFLTNIPESLSANWETAYIITTAYQSTSGLFLTNIPDSLSANWETAYNITTAYQNVSGTFLTNIPDSLSANWETAYNITTAYQNVSGSFLTNIPESLSANWQNAYSLVSGGVTTADYVNTNFLPLSGGIINGDLTATSISTTGNINTTGTLTATSIRSSGNVYGGIGVTILPDTSYTVELSDNGGMIASTNNNSGLTATVVGTNYLPGFQVAFMQLSGSSTTGRITVSGQNITINQANSFFKTTKQYSTATLMYFGEPAGWVLFGDVAS